MADNVSQKELPLHLLRLVSPSQPVGGFSYSRGLEWAVHAGTVMDEQTSSSWILGILEHSYAALDGALFWRMIRALGANDAKRFLETNTWLAAGRESRELELEDRRMSESLSHLLADLGVAPAMLYSNQRLTYPATFAIAAHHWNVSPADALRGLMWSVVEGQVAAAIRLVPLGHTAGQRILIASVPVIERAAHKAATLTDDEIGNMSPGLAMASAWHEIQYSRLFRS
ncbi:urease accessory protein UreF [Phyllobacterium bourgognense]|uniref:Urease accessory protein UreF n=1 Tax=Phyllobacterium bourgognense TaxID=314236 RepID=A0A368YSZ1_9HYPH|nr:urease accessory protein UreF [Phyllobacterium bourgognense]RCW82386.1 urease accessory protein [Phyllobacterium bourgognense]